MFLITCSPMKQKKIGIRGMRMKGTMTLMVIQTETILAQPMITSASSGGIFLSITSRSDVNLLMIRPLGFVSKKERGACIVLSMSVLCIFIEACAI